MKSNALISLLPCLLGLLGTARGQTLAPVVNCESRPACITLYDQAQQQSKDGQLAEALRSYKLAYEVEPDPRLLFSIARVLHKLGQAAEAVSYYDRFIDSAVGDAAQKDKAREYLAQLEPLLPPTPPQPNEQPPRAALIAQSAAAVPHQSVPVYKKGWFWAVLGGSVAAVGLAVGLGVGLSKRTPTLPDGVNTYEPSF